MKVSGRMIKNKFVEKMLLIYGFRAENIKMVLRFITRLFLISFICTCKMKSGY